MISSSSPPMYCPNPGCPQPLNSLGRLECEACQTSLIYRYLWAVGREAAAFEPGSLIADRYYVVEPQVWLDTRPDQSPQGPLVPEEAWCPYLYLHCQRLHIPDVYGTCSLEIPDAEPVEILLLENIPVDAQGHLLPSIVTAWATVPAVRQVYWLWQLCELWSILAEHGVAGSLLVPGNIRVDSWRVRLLELDAGLSSPKLSHLAGVWASWLDTADSSIQGALEDIQQMMKRRETTLERVKTQLNQLLLTEVGKLPFNVEMASVSHLGQVRSQNEDTCYPTAQELNRKGVQLSQKLIPRLSVVCDGVGGHQGGEVASQMAVQSLKPMIQTLLTEGTQSGTELMSPDIVLQQLEEIIRVVNNVISNQNNEQGREGRERMGTTLVMALQFAQKMQLVDGTKIDNSHELYVANVGDSRAYWITAEQCCQLTVDDDVATREVRLGRRLSWQAHQRTDAGALTQALGTRDAQYLHPNLRRFIIEEDGLLLLCSDGFSDHGWVEKSWINYAPAILQGQLPLEAALESWLKLTNERYGHDNISVVISRYGVSSPKLAVFKPGGEKVKPVPATAEMSEASKALLYDEETEEVPAPPPPTQPLKLLVNILGWVVLLAIGGALTLWLSNPMMFQRQPVPEISPSPLEERE